VPRHLCAAFIAAAFSAASAIAAEPQSGGPETEPCERRQATALGQVACELARGLPAASDTTRVVTTKFNGELGAEPKAELGNRLARLVAGELGAKASAREGLLGWATALGEARGARVVALSIELDRTRLAVSADVIASKSKFWERFGTQAPPVVAHAFAARALDAELRAFLPRVPLVISKVHKATLDEPAVAVACGDVDRDGSPELAVVGRKRAHLGRVVGGAFRASASASWPELSSLSPAPLREPIATAAIGNDGLLAVGLSDRESAIVLDHELRVVARYPAKLPWGSAACARRSALGLAPEPVPCSGKNAALDATETLDAVAAAELVTKDGTPLRVSAARLQADGRVRVRLGDRKFELDVAGAQLALGDLDGDGRVELVTTNPSGDPAEDFVSIRTLDANGKSAAGPRIKVPAGVHALSICPPSPSGFSPIVAATGDGLWIFE
jgi:hypothetical protein